MPDRGTLPVSADLKQPGTRRDGSGGVRLLSGDQGANHTHLNKSEKKKREQRKQVEQQNERQKV